MFYVTHQAIEFKYYLSLKTIFFWQWSSQRVKMSKKAINYRKCKGWLITTTKDDKKVWLLGNYKEKMDDSRVLYILVCTDEWIYAPCWHRCRSAALPYFVRNSVGVGSLWCCIWERLGSSILKKKPRPINQAADQTSSLYCGITESWAETKKLRMRTGCPATVYTQKPPHSNPALTLKHPRPEQDTQIQNV